MSEGGRVEKREERRRKENDFLFSHKFLIIFFDIIFSVHKGRAMKMRVSHEKLSKE